jgi:hypothetical protein
VFITDVKLKDIFTKVENVELQKQRMLIAKFFGRNNLAGANGHEWKRKRKVGTCVHA